MILKINNIDISNDIKVIGASINDSAGGVDSLEVLISDTKNLWRVWDIDINDTIEIVKDGFSSGVMYIDVVKINSGICTLKASSLKRFLKENNCRTWENITFLNLCSTIASNLDLKLKAYNVSDYSYDRLDQDNKTDILFLTERAILEGYRVKVTNKDLIVYDEKVFENKASVDDFNVADFLNKYEFKKSILGTYSKCDISYYAKNEFKSSVSSSGFKSSTIKPDIRISSSSEGTRFGNNLLKYKNKFVVTAKFYINLNINLAGSSVVTIFDVGGFSGKYFIETIKQDFINNKSYILARKL